MQNHAKISHSSHISRFIAIARVSVIDAQEATTTPDAGWPVEERCVSAPTKPPKGWSYDGTILMTGYAGIHGVNAKWDTPHILVFLGDNDLWGGALSPDGKWYASPYGHIEVTETYSSFSVIDQVRVFDTTGHSKPYRVDFGGLFYGTGYGQIYWQNNEHFLYSQSIVPSQVMINPFTSQIDIWDKLDPNYDTYDVRLRFAPDWSRVVYDHHNLDYTYQLVLRDIRQLTDTQELPIRDPIIWKPDSTSFIADVSNNANQGMVKPDEKLALFDRNGNLIDTVFLVPKGQQIGRLNTGWSSDGRYFVFITFPYEVYGGMYHLADYGYENTLYILDTQEHQVINTCLKSGIGFAWSPQNHQLAFLESGDGLQNVFILDVDNSKLHSVSKHKFTYLDTGNVLRSSRGVIGWRAD